MRLSPSNAQHLLETTDSQIVLVSKRTAPMLDGKIDSSFDLHTVHPYTAFLNTPNGEGLPAKSHNRCDSREPDSRGRLEHANPDLKGLIMHSSGTTGFPKPIYLPNRYLLQSAACHEFPKSQDIDWVNLSTLPLYHAFGFLAPCLSLSIGMTCCFPPSSIIPAGQSTLDLLKTFDCRSLMTVPNIIDETLAINDGCSSLSGLEFLAVGGGPLKPDQALRLEEHNANLLNHYGATEVGSIAPIFKPGSDYDWPYLRIRSDLGLEVQPIEGSARFKLIGHVFGSDERFEVQDELERNPDSPPTHTEVKVVGRMDDVIVLKTGEKVMPQHLEGELNADPLIKTAVLLGQGRFELTVLIEPSTESSNGNSKTTIENEDQLVEHIWKLISSKNASLDRHAQVTSEKAIIIKPTHKSIPRTDKGSVSKRQVYDLFASEIEAAYVAIESDAYDASLQRFDPENVEGSILRLVEELFPGISSSDVNEDLFELGMDSLQALRLARRINFAVQRHGKSTPDLPAQDATDKTKGTSAELIYKNPTIKMLATATQRLLAENDDGHTAVVDRAVEMRKMVQEFSTRICDNAGSPYIKEPNHGYTVLMTGATGNLGTHVLAQLARSPSIKHVICLCRRKRSQQGPDATRGCNKESKGEDLSIRLKTALDAAHIDLDNDSWAKVEVVDQEDFLNDTNGCDRQTLGQGNGIEDKQVQDPSSAFSQLAGRVDHIVHLAWPMDFKRTLESFTPHMKMLEMLVKLARLSKSLRSTDTGAPARLIFASSIAVVRNHNCTRDAFESPNIVPEVLMPIPETAAPIGYAEGKWVCEHLLDHARRTCGEEVEPVVVRIGQISGPESCDGVWNMREHIPTLVKNSVQIGAFPKLDGVSLVECGMGSKTNRI